MSHVTKMRPYRSNSFTSKKARNLPSASSGNFARSEIPNKKNQCYIDAAKLLKERTTHDKITYGKHYGEMVDPFGKIVFGAKVFNGVAEFTRHIDQNFCIRNWTSRSKVPGTLPSAEFLDRPPSPDREPAS